MLSNKSTTGRDDELEVARSAIEDWSRYETQTNAKLAINNVVWQYGHPALTLHEAEQLAVEFWSKLVNGPAE